MCYNTIISQANDAGDPSITPLAIRKTPRWIEEQVPLPRSPARARRPEMSKSQRWRPRNQLTALGAWVVFS